MAASSGRLLRNRLRVRQPSCAAREGEPKLQKEGSVGIADNSTAIETPLQPGAEGLGLTESRDKVVQVLETEDGESSAQDRLRFRDMFGDVWNVERVDELSVSKRRS